MNEPRFTSRKSDKQTSQTKKNSGSMAHHSVTFSELWQNLSHNYARNRRDFIAAYGGAQCYDKVQALYRDGAIDTAVEVNQASSSTSQRAIASYLGASVTPAIPSNTTRVKTLIITNELLTSDVKFRLLSRGYERGIFYAVLTLKRSPLTTYSTALTTDNWRQHSIFQSRLLTLSDQGHTDKTAPACSSATNDKAMDSYLAKFQPINNDQRDYLLMDEESDSDESSVVNEANDLHEVTSDSADDLEEAQHDDDHNVKKSPTRFIGFGTTMSVDAYRLDIYQQFFYHFFYTTKRMNRDIRLLPGFF